MSKKRKTKQEKIIAAQRNIQFLSQESITPVYTISTAAPSVSHLHHTVSPRFAGHNYSYVMHDMMRTLTITSVLIALSTTFFLLIQNHIIRLAFLGY